MGGGLESRCVGRVCGADGARHGASSWHFKLFHFLTCLSFARLVCAK